MCDDLYMCIVYINDLVLKVISECESIKCRLTRTPSVISSNPLWNEGLIHSGTHKSFV